jgi:hypothetical protein
LWGAFEADNGWRESFPPLAKTTLAVPEFAGIG